MLLNEISNRLSLNPNSQIMELSYNSKGTCLVLIYDVLNSAKKRFFDSRAELIKSLNDCIINPEVAVTEIDYFEENESRLKGHRAKLN